MKDIRHHMNHEGYHIFELFEDDEYVTHMCYLGYSKAEALARFKEHIA